MLSDPAKRRNYDTGGFAVTGGMSAEDLFAGIDFEDLLRGTGLHFGGFDFGGGLFENLFGLHSRGPPRGRDIELALEVPLERIASGGDETVRVPRAVRCGGCGGSGARDGKVRACQACNGTGREVKTRAEGGITLSQARPCPACGGRGRLIDEPCTTCQGTGTTEEVETLTVTVPVGVEEGTMLRVPGHGMADAGGPPGDLLISIHSLADPRFERDGADLWRVEPLTIPEAVLGTQREVPTLGAPAVVRIPPGTQPDAVLRLAAKGLPRFGRQGHGNLLIRLQLRVPTTLSAEELSLYQRLQALQADASKT